MSVLKGDLSNVRLVFHFDPEPRPLKLIHLSETISKDEQNSSSVFPHLVTSNQAYFFKSIIIKNHLKYSVCGGNHSLEYALNGKSCTFFSVTNWGKKAFIFKRPVVTPPI